jgi:hypothetical protein
MIADLEQSLGPFDDPGWRADLSRLAEARRTASVQWAVDAQVIDSLAARVPRSPGDERGGTPWTSFVREVAVARLISDRAAHAEVALSLALCHRHPRTLRLLGEGLAPAHRARVLVERCLLQADDVVAAVEEQLAGRLAMLTPARLAQEIDRIALRLDAQAAARQEAVANAARTAVRRSQPHAQGEIVLTGPAVLVQRWWDALTDRARALKAAGDPRTLSALRFDLAVTTDPRLGSGTDPVLAALGLAPPCPAASAGSTGPGDSTGLRPPLTQDARCSRPVQVLVTVPAATALGLSEEPGWLDGHGWISAPMSRQLLSVAELRKACVAPHSGQLLDLADQVVRPRLDPQARREAVRSMVLTPHHLRDLVVDSQPQHDPSPALEAFVQARDRFCDGPTGTRVPASRTDTDHDRPWPAGSTRASNLISRAGRTHHLKHAGWTALRDATGTTWLSPAGQRAHAPAHHHPPEPLAPSARLPDVDQLTRNDAALTRPPPWAHELPTDERPPPEAGSDVAADASGSRLHGWSDTPAF